jgi:phosphate transport system permease protein
MAEYASRPFRSIVKPLLEILAGIPTIVYGFFALVTVGPVPSGLLCRSLGCVDWRLCQLHPGTERADRGSRDEHPSHSLRLVAVGRHHHRGAGAMRDGSLGLGATRSETMKRVILPAALPGIMGALLLTGSRAIGETMIVVLAAGVAANLQFSPSSR